MSDAKPIVNDSEAELLVVADHSFSFTKSAHGNDLVTDVIQFTTRMPEPDPDAVYYPSEVLAHRSLGLPAGAPFLAIWRARLFGGIPRALHRAYLDPARFPGDFTSRHELNRESLLDVYRHYGYTLLSRDTVLTARLTQASEREFLRRRYGKEPGARLVVLEAEQRLYATDPATKTPFVLEFLSASYLDNWRYEITNRPDVVG